MTDVAEKSGLSEAQRRAALEQAVDLLNRNELVAAEVAAGSAAGRTAGRMRMRCS